MVTNYLVLPHPALRPFVRNYILATSESRQIAYSSQWPASNNILLIFYLRDEPLHQGGRCDSSLAFKRGYMTGHMTNQNGIVHFHGNYLTFIIQFETDGFSKISRIPTSEITNKIIVANDIFGNVTSNLYEQLINVSDINTMTKISDTFLLSLLNRQKNSHQLPDSISYISNQINRTREFLRIRDYAYRSNMSLRNFERRFLEHTGLSPTNYIQLLRFNNVLKTKLTNPFLSWAAIAADCGYYDQMHMIRDFKRFSNLSPTAYFENDEKFERPSINIFDSDGVTLGKLQSNLPKEYFIFIERQGI